MIDEQYQSFFDCIQAFTTLKNQQKLRGLNDYNIVNIVRNEFDEVGLHSRVLHSLLDPQGLHYQEDLFLKLFITEVLQITDFGDTLTAIVEREERTQDARRIDFTIKNTNYYIGIEMKLNASDGQNQLSDYKKDLLNKAKSDNHQTVIIYYLSLNRKSADHRSSNDIEYRPISFKNHILPWIEKCQKEVYNITNLNQAFENYKWIVQKTTNQYRSQVMSFLEYLKSANMDNEVISNVFNEIDEIQNATKTYFMKQLEEYLNQTAQRFLPVKTADKATAIEQTCGSFIIKLLHHVPHSQCACQIFWKKNESNPLKDKNGLTAKLKIATSNKETTAKSTDQWYDNKMIWMIFSITYEKKINFQNKEHLFDLIKHDLEKIEKILIE